MKADIVRAWQAGGKASVIVRVAGAGTNLQGEALALEMTVSTPLLDAQEQVKTVATLKADLLTAAKAAYAAELAARQPPPVTDIPWTGQVDLG